MRDAAAEHDRAAERRVRGCVGDEAEHRVTREDTRADERADLRACAVGKRERWRGQKRDRRNAQPVHESERITA
jgi:hypothetical protein